MRTHRTLAAALALPGLTTALLIPLAAPAAAAPVVPATTQSFSGYCSLAPDASPLSSSGARVELPYEPDATHAGFADAQELSAAAYVRSVKETHQPTEDCGAEAAFSNAVHVLPGTSGLAPGAEVTLVATVDYAATLDSTLDVAQRSDALSSSMAKAQIEDPNPLCNEGCSTLLTYQSVSDRRVVHQDGASSESGDSDGSLRWYTDDRWSMGTLDDHLGGGAGPRDGEHCSSFGCPGGLPGEDVASVPPLQVAPGPQSMAFTTRVGAVLRVSGSVSIDTVADYGRTTATTDARPSLDVDLGVGDHMGLDLHVGPLAPADTTPPTTGSSVDVEPNANGWNNGPVVVTLTAQDETALGGIAYTTSTGGEGSGASPLVATISEPGTTVLSWTASDAAGNRVTGTRTVQIDVTDPSLTVPTAVSAPAGTSGTAVVSYVTGSSDDLSGVSVSCTPASGSTFPLGETTVVCTAVDGAGNDTSKEFVVTVTQPTTVAAHIAALRQLITSSPMDEILRKKLLNDLDLLEKAYEKGRGATKGCKELGDLQLRVSTATSIDSGTRSLILTRAGQLGELLGC